MKSELQIKRKFATVKKERNKTFDSLLRHHRDIKGMSTAKRLSIIKNCEESVNNMNGFLEALRWVM